LLVELIEAVVVVVVKWEEMVFMDRRFRVRDSLFMAVMTSTLASVACKPPDGTPDPAILG
jgi:hypothetical protein